MVKLRDMERMMGMSEFEEKTINRKRIFTGKVIQVDVETVEVMDHTEQCRELVRHPGAVCMLPITRDGRIILVRQYRKAIESDLWEIPAGKIEASEDDLIEVARRELEEEIRCQGHLEEVMAFYPSPGFSSERLTLFTATDLVEIEQPKVRDADEFMEVRAFTMEEIATLLAHQKLDAKTIIALQYYQLKLRK